MNRSTLLRLHDRIAERACDRLRDPLLLFVRATWGYFFFRTGMGKLGDLEGTADFFARIGLPLASTNALLVGLLECVGGLLLLLGLGGRTVALLLSGNMLVAYLTAHRAELGSLQGFVDAEPYPFLLAALLVLAFGPGRFSIDALLRRRAVPAMGLAATGEAGA